jgi:hypothetical protein
MPPRCSTDAAATHTASRAASTGPAPASEATTKAAAKVSPAPVGSTSRASTPRYGVAAALPPDTGAAVAERGADDRRGVLGQAKHLQLAL